jgi:hypothetical protein
METEKVPMRQRELKQRYLMETVKTGKMTLREAGEKIEGSLTSRPNGSSGLSGTKASRPWSMAIGKGPLAIAPRKSYGIPKAFRGSFIASLTTPILARLFGIEKESRSIERWSGRGGRGQGLRPTEGVAVSRIGGDGGENGRREKWRFGLGALMPGWVRSKRPVV